MYKNIFWLILLSFSSGLSALTLPVRNHPFLLADSNMINHAKWKTQRYIWANNVLNSIKISANGALSYMTIPDQPGTSYNHKMYWQNIRTLGLAYAFTGYEPYAQGARTLLLQYAEKYPVWGRAFDDLLEDCVCGNYAIWGYDLIYNSPCLSAADKENIETNFFRNLAEYAKSYLLEGNHQTWHNSTIAAVGLVLEDAELVDYGLNGPRGLLPQLRINILRDGWWNEVTPGYHLYALDALRFTVQAAAMAGFDYTDNPAYKGMFDAPIASMMPDYTLPSINDTALPYNISDRRYYYEQAYAKFGDPNYLLVLNMGTRDTIDALLFGADVLPPTPSKIFKSVEGAESGIAVLRPGNSSNQINVTMDYGPHGMWHGHRDKLAMTLYGLGRVLSPDPSLLWNELAFTTPEWKYFYRQTFAHNTVCVDQNKQNRAEGVLEMFYSEPNFSVIQAQCCDNAYPDVLMRRTLALTDKYVIDIFVLKSENKHNYDWVYHNYGVPAVNISMSPRSNPIGYTAGYQYLTNITQGSANNNFNIDFTQTGANVRVTMLGASDTDVFLGACEVGSYSWPTSVVRRKTNNTVFISVIEPYSATPLVTGISAVPVNGAGAAYAIEINCTGGRKDLFLLADFGGQRQFENIATTGRACYVKMQSGAIVQESHIE